ncbi:helix-turn-helix domain-containing protein [Herbidospora cretacea]|uniref:helix-turn-helix domain-containing protein n=1 Tax=Herbidospora cretacea TaxID=28444 RepID=UPI0009EE144F|nr:helix-turn-helix transcriptional regulator [Herbidospora cretacea]
MSIGHVLRELREAAGLSQSELAAQLCAASGRSTITRAEVSRWENGKRTPSRFWINHLAMILDVPESFLGQPERLSPSFILQAVSESQSVLDGDDAFDALSRGLAVNYLDASPLDALRDARDVRNRIFASLAVKPTPNLYLSAGLASGVLAYATLDLGYGKEASIHAKSVFHFGELAGHNGLRAWARGTQSLIARFLGDFKSARDFLDSGFPYATEGTSSVRLLCGTAQCLAHQGDSRSAHEALNKALDLRDTMRPSADDEPGIFGFPIAKQHYYAGSSLIWLDGEHDSVRADKESTEAIALFEASPEKERSHSDEALARIYRATARLQQSELDGAIESYREVLNLPQERQISWIVRRLDRIYAMLGRFDSPLASEARDEIMASVRTPSAQ